MFVRKLENEDWKAYKALRLEALRLHADKYGSSYEENVGRSDAEWQDDLCGASQAFFGLFDGDEMVGSGGIFMKGEASKCGILIGGYIRKEYRGKGYSRLIYEARIEWARDSGLFDRLLIGHRKGNEASRRANGRGFVTRAALHCADSTPSRRRRSATGQARRPLMRSGRSGPSSLHAHRRRVCGCRPRCAAAVAVSTAVRASRPSGTSD